MTAGREGRQTGLSSGRYEWIQNEGGLAQVLASILSCGCMSFLSSTGEVGSWLRVCLWEAPGRTFPSVDLNFLYLDLAGARGNHSFFVYSTSFPVPFLCHLIFPVLPAQASSQTFTLTSKLETCITGYLSAICWLFEHQAPHRTVCYGTSSPSKRANFCMCVPGLSHRVPLRTGAAAPGTSAALLQGTCDLGDGSHGLGCQGGLPPPPCLLPPTSSPLYPP